MQTNPIDTQYTRNINHIDTNHIPHSLNNTHNTQQKGTNPIHKSTKYTNTHNSQQTFLDPIHTHGTQTQHQHQINQIQPSPLDTNTHTVLSSPVYQSNYARSLQTRYQPIEHIQTGEIPRLPTLTYKPPFTNTKTTCSTNTTEYPTCSTTNSTIPLHNI